MHLPAEVNSILDVLHQGGFEAYAVGGCVRDLLLTKVPKDWDVTTNATPEEIRKLFSKSFYANQFGTVTVLTESDEPSLQQVEVTTYRVESDYSDQRRPDSVRFVKSLEEDLSRRDFTINAMAMTAASETEKSAVVIEGLTIIDLFGGIKDLHAGVIRAVGEPAERFAEDALRLLRAVRFAAQLDFTIDGQGVRNPDSKVPDTFSAIKAAAPQVAAVSQERVRDELIKMVMSDSPEAGFNLLQHTGLLAQVLPELAEGVGVGQNKHHIYTVFDHCIKSLQFAARYDYPLPVRLAALFHDIGKPRTKRKQGSDYTFYAHDVVGARMTEKLMTRLRFPSELKEQVTHLVRHHMFYYDVGKVTEAGMRRLLRRVGTDHFGDLIKLRIAERKGSGVPKAEPYRLRHLQFLAEKVSQQAITVGQLVIGGNDLIKELNLKPGPQIGGILNALLAEVIDDPLKNERAHLLQRARELKDKDPAALKLKGEAARDEELAKRDETIRRKYHV